MKFIISLFFFCLAVTTSGQSLKDADGLVKTGNFTQAKIIYENALQGREKCKDSTLLIVKQLVTTELLMGDVKGALKRGLYYSECKGAFEVYNLLGAVYSITRNIDSSLHYYKKSVKGVSDKGKVYNNIGVLYQANIDSSLRYHTLALKYYQQKQDSVHVARSFNNLAHALRLSDSNRAIALYQRSVLVNKYNYFLMLESLVSLSELTRQVRYVRKADSLIKRLQGGIVRRADKLRFLKQSKRLFQVALRVYTSLYLKVESKRYLDTLFYFSERAKGNVMVSQLAKQVISMQDVQSWLSDQKALLEYFQTPKGLYCLVVTKSGKQLVKVSSLPAKELELQVRKYTASINSLGLRGFMLQSPIMYKLFFEPVSKCLSGVGELLLIPCLSLSSIPFEGFMCKPSVMSETGYKSADYLLKRYTFTYNISATLAMNNSTKRYGKAFFGFVQSVFKNGLNPLKYGEMEVLNARKYFKEGVVLKNDKATPEKLKNIDVEVLHVSTHGFYDFKNTSSGIWVKSSGEDVVLNANRLFRLKPRGKLVVLSGCFTAVGEVVDGEGVVNLPYIFIYSGSRYILSSLYAIPDRATYKMMSKFYGYYAKGFGYTKALQLAKIEMVKTSLS